MILLSIIIVAGLSGLVGYSIGRSVGVEQAMGIKSNESCVNELLVATAALRRISNGVGSPQIEADLALRQIEE